MDVETFHEHMVPYIPLWKSHSSTGFTIFDASGTCCQEAASKLVQLGPSKGVSVSLFWFIGATTERRMLSLSESVWPGWKEAVLCHIIIFPRRESCLFFFSVFFFLLFFLIFFLWLKCVLQCPVDAQVYFLGLCPHWLMHVFFFVESTFAELRIWSTLTWINEQLFIFYRGSCWLSPFIWGTVHISDYGSIALHYVYYVREIH